MGKTFAEARRRAPCILFIDEIDAVGSRTDSDRQNRSYRTQVINGFLGEMNAISIKEGVIVIGACNHPERMDAAMVRAGRFDLKIEVPLPDADQILAVLRQHLHEDIADPELRSLSRKAVGRTPAEIDAAIRAARSDARHARKMLNIAMLRDHLGIRLDGEHVGQLWRVAVHEAGHAVICAALGLGQVTGLMVSGEGGHATRRCAPVQGLLSDIDAEIAYSLGGRAAERLVFGEVSSEAGGPAQSDLARATRHALDIEATYGLGLEGPVWHETPAALMLQNSHLRGRVRQRIERAERRAGTILAANRELIERLAEDLLRQRSMKTPEIGRWLRQVTPEADTIPAAATSGGKGGGMIAADRASVHPAAAAD